MQGLERAVLEGADCYRVLWQTAAARGALNGLMAELIESRFRFHTVQPKASARGAEREVGRGDDGHPELPGLGGYRKLSSSLPRGLKSARQG